MAKIFPITVGSLGFHPEKSSQASLLATLRQLEGLNHSLECRGPSNSYQLNSDFDKVVRRQLLTLGGREIAIRPQFAGNIDFDLALELHGGNVVFEIEK